MNNEANIWIVDDDDSLRWVLKKTFDKTGLNVRVFEDAYEALEALNELDAEHQKPDTILSDIRMPGMDGLTFLQKVHAVDNQIPIIIMTAHSDLDSAVASFETGAFEYLPKPFDIDDAVSMVQRALAYKKQLSNQTDVQSEPSSSQSTDNSDADSDTESNSHVITINPKSESAHISTKKPSKNSKSVAQPQKIIGESPAMQEVFRAIGRLAKSNVTVLITGESGTGKELIAKALHEHSPRKDAIFIALNMAAIPTDLIEAELFGHEKGAFTGATSQRKGRFEQANGGTLFLDEIGDMPFATQTRLLRVLASGEFYRVGGHIPVKVDVRIVAATHQNLEERVNKGVFREDLYYRLNVIRLQLPALRERTEDIPMLAAFFLTKYANEMGVPIKNLQPEAIAALQKFQWRGNIRQLENVCRWLTVMVTSQHVSTHDLPKEFQTDFNSPETKNSGISGIKDTDIKNPENTSNAGTSDIHTSEPKPSKTHGSDKTEVDVSWQTALTEWLTSCLQKNDMKSVLNCTDSFEMVLIETALAHTNGRKGDAAKILGWGRNTLSRKMQLLDMT